MVSLSNSRWWQNHKERLERSKNNGDMTKRPKRLVSDRVSLFNWREPKLLKTYLTSKQKICFLTYNI